MSEWESYRWRKPSLLVELWIEALPTGNRVKNALKREADRVSTLATTGVYFHEGGPVEPEYLALLREDARSWSDPAAVLRLLRLCPWIIAGDKTRMDAIAAIEAYLATHAGGAA